MNKPGSGTDNKPQIVLSHAVPLVEGKSAFSGDQLNRKVFAERLSDYVNRLKDGAVIAIDAPWGEGKTWFGHNWARLLEEHGHKVMFLDVFAHDYVDDPFLMLSAQILEAIKDNEALHKGLTDKAVTVAKALTPLAATVAINVAARWVLGSPDISKVVRDALAAGIDASEPGLGSAVKQRLTHFQDEKSTIDGFREMLSAYCLKAGNEGKPVVFFIDELDRCRPSFAVQVIERIKHFFEVPNLVFVLLINRSQLETAITGVYGAIDSHRYLGKFLSLTFRFPGNDRVPGQEGAQKARYIHAVLSRYHISTPPLGLKRKAPLFPDGLAFIAEVFGLSLRDLEQAIALSVLANPGLHTGGYLALVVGLKIAYPILFRAMCEKRLPEFDKAAQILEDWVDRSVKAGQSQGISMDDEVYQYIVWLKLCAGSIAREDTTVLLLQQGLLQQENPSITISSDMQDSPSRLFYLSLFIDLAARIECGITIDRP
ncbi:MAG: KAP family P-loop NTPase fold protein [Acidiferrobacter sp.]